MEASSSAFSLAISYIPDFIKKGTIPFRQAEKAISPSLYFLNSSKSMRGW